MKRFSIAKPESSILVGIALAKSGPEAIAESFYASIQCQKQPGGQTNESLVRRTNVNLNIRTVNIQMLI